MFPFYTPWKHQETFFILTFHGYKIVQALFQNEVANPNLSKVNKRKQKNIAQNYLYLKQGKTIHLQYICQNHYKSKNLFLDQDWHSFWQDKSIGR